jgi:dTDP-4-amino-4,6-dideoxygalactose transaminase
MEELASRGGPLAKPTPYTMTNRYGAEDLEQLSRALETGKLMGPGGIVAEFEEALCAAFEVRHAVTVTSGTAALHTALCALGVSEGDEVITTHMTDIGTVAAILALHAILVFADIDLDPGSSPLRVCDPASAHGPKSSLPYTCRVYPATWTTLYR